MLQDGCCYHHFWLSFDDIVGIWTMESIIQHLEKMTGYRDHDLLNISIAPALREIVDASSARVFEFVANEAGTFLRSKVDITATDVTLVEQQEVIHLSSGVCSIPGLQSAITNRHPVVEATTDTGLSLYFLLWNGEKLGGYPAMPSGEATYQY